VGVPSGAIVLHVRQGELSTTVDVDEQSVPPAMRSSSGHTRCSVTRGDSNDVVKTAWRSCQ
jgi:hypothetical protein